MRTCLLKSIVLNTWQHTFPCSPFGLSGHPGRAAVWADSQSTNMGFTKAMVKVHFDFSRAKNFLSPYHYISWLSTLLHIFLSNFKQTYFSLLTKIFMMNSNYSVVVVSWVLSCGPMCIHSSSVWMHNEEIGWVFIYVRYSLPYPQTLTWRSLNWEVNTKMWMESLVQDVQSLVRIDVCCSLSPSLSILYCPFSITRHSLNFPILPLIVIFQPVFCWENQSEISLVWWQTNYSPAPWQQMDDSC